MITFVRKLKGPEFIGFGLLFFGKRESVNVILAKNDSASIGLDLNFSHFTPIHFGVTLGRRTIYIQLFGYQF